MKNYFLVVFSSVLIFSSVIILYVWPSELSLIFNSLFGSSILMLVNSCVLLFYMYRKGASSEKILFVFSLMLIISAALMYSGFEEIASNMDNWKPYFKSEYQNLFIYLPMFISYTKNIIAFGFAAIGAGVCASIIIHRFYKNA